MIKAKTLPLANGRLQSDVHSNVGCLTVCLYVLGAAPLRIQEELYCRRRLQAESGASWELYSADQSHLSGRQWIVDRANTLLCGRPT